MNILSPQDEDETEGGSAKKRLSRAFNRAAYNAATLVIFPIFAGILLTAGVAMLVGEFLNPSFQSLVEDGNLRRAKFALWKNRALANTPFSAGNSDTPLMAAVENNDLAMTKLLLRYGAAIAARNSWDVCPILRATALGHKEVLEALLEHDSSSLNELRRHGSATALTVAAEEGRLDIVRLLMTHGARLNVTDHFGHSALSKAVARRDGEINVSKKADLTAVADFLKQNIAGLLEGRAPGENRITPLMRAAADGTLEIVETILACDDSSVNDTHRFMRSLVQGAREVPEIETALKNAVHCDGTNGAAIVKLLLAHGARQDIDYEGSETPLMAAQSRPDIVRMLLENDASTVNHLRMNLHSGGILGDDGVVHSALTHAVHRGWLETAKLLLKHGARQDLATTKSPMELALEKGKADMIELLEQHARDAKAADAASIAAVYTGLEEDMYVEPIRFVKRPKPTL